MNYDILIVSPHMDDAVLSLGEHIIGWKSEGKKILVVTVFTKFIEKNIPDYSRNYMEKSGFYDVIDFENARKEEDINAMWSMGVDYKHWNFVDAGFRGIYKTREKLLSGKIKDKDLINKIRMKILEIETDKIYLPYGVGGNVDHLIVKEAGKIFKNISYFMESPYLWQKLNFVRFLLKIKNIKKPSIKKEKILKEYKSQFELLKQNVWWPLSEIVVKNDKNI